MEALPIGESRKRRRLRWCCFHGLVKVLITLAQKDMLVRTQGVLLAPAVVQTACSLKPNKGKSAGGRKS